MPKISCIHCADTGWVCENHLSKPWAGFSNRRDACDCGQARRAARAMDLIRPI